jgi:MerR family Zn(II)-responsive transcriptional regulator of zntA
MTVDGLARKAGVAPHVVRYYTQRGLLEPRRNARNGYREYAPADFHRLRFICRAKLIGFTLSDISLILQVADDGVAPSQRVRRIIRTRAKDNEERLAAAQRLQDRIQRALDQWESRRDGLPDHESLCRLIDVIAIDSADDDEPTASAGREGLA